MGRHRVLLNPLGMTEIEGKGIDGKKWKERKDIKCQLDQFNNFRPFNNTGK